MSWIGSLISGLFGTGQQAWQNAYNSKQAEKNRNFQSDEADENRAFQSEEAEKARFFNSSEAALQRDWSAAEAEQARDWQEEMYAKYNSLSGKISQAEQAGVNPMLAITGNSVSPMAASSSAPSGASASGSPSPSGAIASGSAASNGMLNILGAILDGLKLKSEIDLNKSQAQKNIAQAEGQNITNAQLHDMNAAEILSKLSNVELNNSNINLISAKILNTSADTDLKSAQLGEVASRIANTNADTSVKQQQIAVMLSEIAKNDQSVELMKAQTTELGQMYENLLQEHGHHAVMNSIQEIAFSRDSGAGPHSNGYYRATSEVKRFIDSFLGWFSGGASVTKVFGNK